MYNNTKATRYIQTLLGQKLFVWKSNISIFSLCNCEIENMVLFDCICKIPNNFDILNFFLFQLNEFSIFEYR